MNHLASATTYNDHGLPLSFSGGAPLLFENLSAFSQLEVTYDCGGTAPSIGK